MLWDFENQRSSLFNFNRLKTYMELEKVNVFEFFKIQ